MKTQLFTKRKYTKPQMLDIFNQFCHFDDIDKALSNLRCIFPDDTVALVPGENGKYESGKLVIGDYSIVW